MQFIAAGFSADLYWSLTPRELSDHFKAAQLRDIRDRDLAMYAAWHGAAFERSKKMPGLKEVLSKQPSGRRNQTAEEAKAVMKAIFASRKKGTS